MAAYKHGAYGSEETTSLVPMTEISAGLPVVVGTAPLHLASDPATVNMPVLCYNYSEAVAAFGYSDDWDKYTLCEFMDSHFSLFNMAPVVFINVLDPKIHKKDVEKESLTLKDGQGYIEGAAVLLDTLVIRLTEAGEPLSRNTDYTAAYNKASQVVVTALSGGKITSQTATLSINYTKLDADLITRDDIVGGVDVETGDLEGLELINRVFSKTRLIPGLILAPKWSRDSAVAAVMKAKCTNISGHFEALALCDADTKELVKYSDVPEWKNLKNYSDPYQVACWPKLSLGGVQYHFSTQLAGVICKTDSEHDDIPYWPPSNQNLQADAAVLDNGKEIFLDSANAAYLNGQGIVTALNFIGGWKVWGNRTSCYPANTDVKDAFISIRRMFNWVNNTLITTFWSKIDNPANKALVNCVLDSANLWLNGLTPKYLLGASVEFRADDNPTTDLMDGIVKFRVKITPPSPARAFEFIQEYDTNNVSSLTSGSGN